MSAQGDACVCDVTTAVGSGMLIEVELGRSKIGTLQGWAIAAPSRCRLTIA